MLVSAAEKFRAERDHFWIGQDERDDFTDKVKNGVGLW